jgi:serralysin
MSTKPVYDTAQLIHALTTQDGAQPSVAWATDIVTFSIDTGRIGPDNDEYTPEMAGHVAMTPAMRAAAREAFALWDELIAIDLLELAAWPDAHITFNYSSNTGGATYANYAYWLIDNEPRSQYRLADADLWFADNWPSHDQDSDLTQGSFGILTYLHEIGHALGLTHPGDYNGSGSYEADATHRQDTRQYTVMSYFQAGADGSGADHFSAQGWSHAATPLLHDILALQAVYGADMTTRIADTVYGFNSTAGHAAFDFTRNPEPVVAIWDAGGIDRIDVSGWSTDQVVDLSAGAFSSVGSLTLNLAIAHGATIEQAVGGGGNDRLTGNAADNLLLGNGGSDRLEGGDGTDTLEGGPGDDLLYGGNGSDILRGGDGPDTLFGGPGADIHDGGAGGDWVRFALAASGVTMSLLSGAGTGGEAAGDTYLDIENVSGSPFADHLTGSLFANRIEGGDGDDLIEGLSGHDFLLGGAGDDTITGDYGIDILRGGPGADLLDGGVARDWVQYNTAAAGVTLSLASGGTGGEAAGDSFVSVENVLGSDFADSIAGNFDRNQILGGGGDDWIDGGDGPDVLSGEAGDDTLIGGLEGDTLYGGPGADTLIGGDKYDWARYDDSPSGVTVDLAAGGGAGGDAEGDTLDGIEFLWGSAHADTLLGDDGVNMIRGGGGGDLIRGRGGNDIMEGFGGADVFVFGPGDDLDRIHNLEPALDRIRFEGAVAGFDALVITDFNGDAAIGYGPGDTILLTGISSADVSAGLFEFA